MNCRTAETRSMPSAWVMPLGQTPDYLDSQSQEALYEVDVNGMARFYSSTDVGQGAPGGDRHGAISSGG